MVHRGARKAEIVRTEITPELSEINYIQLPSPGKERAEADLRRAMIDQAIRSPDEAMPSPSSSRV